MTPFFREKWATFSLRERRMVQVAAAVVGLGLLFGLAIDPALRNITRLQKELPNLRTDAATVKAYADEARRLSAVGKQLNASGAIATRSDIEKSLVRAGLKDFAKVGGTDQQPQILLSGAPFGATTEWVNLAPKELSVRIVRAKFERAGGAGKVSGELVLDAAGGARN